MIRKSSFGSSSFLCQCLALAVLLSAGAARAHRVSAVSLISYLDTEKKTYTLDVAMEVIPSEDPELNDQISPEDAAREFAEEYLVVMFDEKDQKPEIEIHLEETSDEDTPPELRKEQVLTKLSGRIPDGANEFLLYLDPACPMAVVMVVIKDEQTSRRMQVILAGEYSRPISVAPIVAGDPFAEGDGAPPSPEGESKDEQKIGTAGENGGTTALLAGGRGYFREGLLSLALLIGVLLLSPDLRSVLRQGVILLVGQSLVVALAASNLVAVPASVPAWSSAVLMILVAGLSLEAFFHSRIGWWRLPLVAVAALFSGWEIAGSDSFRKIYTSEGSGAGEAVAFLAGMEIAFVVTGFVVASLLASLSRFRRYRSTVVHPLSAVVAGYALFCLVEGFL